jgi:beta-N-acetylhexosaminidase
VIALASCHSGSQRTAGPLATRAGTASPSVTSTGSAGCSNLEVIRGWPVARRAALLVVAPVLNFDKAVMQRAAHAAVGGILLLGAARPPSSLAGEVRSTFTTTSSGPRTLVMADEEGGGVQRLEGAVGPIPWPRDLARTMSTAQVADLAASVGRQMLQVGVDVDLAPVLDLDGRDGPTASNPDGSRSFSADPSTAGRYGVAFARGLTSSGVLPVLKHFPGLGGASTNTDYGSATTLPITALRASALPPFQSAIASGAAAVMISNASVPGLTPLPSSLSDEVITGLLRQTLGFQGLVLTDSLSAGAINQTGYGVPRAAVAAVTAGADMVLFGSTVTPAETALLTPDRVTRTIGEIVGAIVDATSAGSLPVTRLDDAVQHVLVAQHVDLCGR